MMRVRALVQSKAWDFRRRKHRNASAAPADYLHLGHERGRIAPGYRADLVLLDDDLGVVETWIDGIPASGDGVPPGSG